MTTYEITGVEDAHMTLPMGGAAYRVIFHPPIMGVTHVFVRAKDELDAYRKAGPRILNLIDWKKKRATQ